MLNIITKPIILAVQPNPILGISCCASKGNRTPPVAFPQLISAMAKALRFRKYVAAVLTAGV
jgi:hypothetical protein